MDNKYIGLPSVDSEQFNGFPEDDRFYSFFFDGENTEAVDMLEMDKILASDEYKGQLLVLVLRNTKIFIATSNTPVKKTLSAMASGCLALVPKNTIFETVFNRLELKDNVHLSFYVSNQDLREQIDFYLNDRIKRVCTARNGQYFVTSNHTDKIRTDNEKCD